ncbi:MAG: hypothetical protein R2706_11680 [Acidimicrobiales bacterium]
MPNLTIATRSFAALCLLLGASCRSSAPDEAVATAQTVVTDSPATTAASASEDSPEASVGFGELTEGSFIFSGAVDEAFYTSNPELGFRLGGGCQGGQFGVSLNITDVAATTSYAFVRCSDSR